MKLTCLNDKTIEHSPQFGFVKITLLMCFTAPKAKAELTCAAERDVHVSCGK